MSDASEAEILDQLELVIRDRRESASPTSYTSRLLQGGVPAIAEKIIEEAHELIEAVSQMPTAHAGSTSTSTDSKPDPHVVHEAADLLFHTLVMLGYAQVPLAAVRRELARRFGTSGLEEKAARESRDSSSS